MTASEHNAKMFSYVQINAQENTLLKSFSQFYENEKNIADFTTTIQTTVVSIRLIYHFVTGYAKKNKILCKLIDNNIINVYQSYKQQLKRYQKKYFDPFARGIRVPYYIGNNWFITTLGQLNFFKWFISNNILDYVIKNKNNIEIDMNKNKKNKSDTKIKKKKNNCKKIESKFISYKTNEIQNNENKIISNKPIRVTF